MKQALEKKAKAIERLKKVKQLKAEVVTAVARVGASCAYNSEVEMVDEELDV